MKAIGPVAEYDDEDVSEVIQVIEKSFQVRFKKDAFLYIQNVGDLVQVVESYIRYPHNESCTSQSVFYRVCDSHTVRELVEKVSSEHYMAVRSQAGTVNRNEILDTVINILSSRMGVDKKYINAET